MSNLGLLEELKTRMLTADGAMGTLLYSYGIDYCNEELNIAKTGNYRERSIRIILRPEQILFKRIHTEQMRLSCALWTRKSSKRN